MQSSRVPVAPGLRLCKRGEHIAGAGAWGLLRSMAQEFSPPSLSGIVLDPNSNTVSTPDPDAGAYGSAAGHGLRLSPRMLPMPIQGSNTSMVRYNLG